MDNKIIELQVVKSGRQHIKDEHQGWLADFDHVFDSAYKLGKDLAESNLWLTKANWLIIGMAVEGVIQLAVHFIFGGK